MYRKLIYIISLILVQSIAANASANLVGHWKFDDGSGTTARDSSGNGYHGTLYGDPQWTDGQLIGALKLDGANDYVDLPISPVLRSLTNCTIATWVNWSGQGGAWQRVFDFGTGQTFNMFLTPNNGATGSMRFAITITSWNDEDQTTAPAGFPSGWHHVAVTMDATNNIHTLYIDGQVVAQNTAARYTPSDLGNTTQNWLGRSQYPDPYFNGSLDDFRIYDQVLTPAEIKELTARPWAHDPNPANKSIYPDTWAILTWGAGDFAASHDVYFGDNFDDVNDGTGGTFQGNQDNIEFIVGFLGYPYPDGLVRGTTYYWRIDEVNDLHPDSPWKGSVWSFWIPTYKAYEPNPPDEAKFIDTNVTLTWTAGYGARLHTVYFGEDFDTVNNATGGTRQGLIGYSPGPLELDKTYYWRVDEYDGSITYKGDVWSFSTRPVISITDPNLVGWWKFDEGQGTAALDWSGYGHHATLVGDPQWTAGYDGGALALDGADDYVVLPIGSVISSLTNSTFTTWVNFSNAGGAWQRIFDFGTGITVNMFLTPRIGTTEPMRFAITTGGAAAEEQATAPDTLPSGWHHVAVTISADTRTITLYLDGVLVASNTAATLTPSDLGNTTNNWLGRSQYDVDAYFMGSLDDFRIYNFAMTADEIPETMRGDPMLAWSPNPADGSTPDIKVTLPLSWSPGDKASEHDVYFGTNQEAVENADISDTTGVYRKRQNTTSYTPPEGVEWGQTYYWRIDQYNTDGTTSKGRVWSFMVADFILVDDFEIYDAGANQIWYAWRDGLGFGAIVTPPYSPGNGTGSAVGDETTDSYTEENIVNSGAQSMPYWYDNNKPDKMKYSEAKLTLSDTRDLTEEQVKALSLWFRGYPASVGSFTESPAGTYTMTGSGADIWNLGPGEGQYHDEFHYAYKTLTGPGTITARVDSVQNTHASAKAGVMIRETLDANSAHAMMVVTPTDGIKFEGRREPGASSFSYSQTGITAPHWVRLERDLAGNFTVSHSANGTTWEEVQNALVENIPMSANVYIGLAVTAHDPALTCEAVFSNVTITGSVSPQWMHQDIGILSNAPEPMYVAVANNTGTPAVVYHDDPNAAQIDTWTEWNIDLKDFADKGVILTDVNSIAIGFGDRNNPQAGGSGKMYFDDIRLYRPRYVSGKGTPLAADLNSDGVVDMADVEVMASDWLDAGPALASDLNTDSTVDFKDYAVLADMWLEEQLWPEW